MNLFYKYMSKISLLIVAFGVAILCAAQNTKISGGNSFSMSICVDSSVLTWGKNDHGQLGQPLSITLYDVPTAIPTTYALPKIIAVDAGSGSTAYALDKYGKVWAWGEDKYGQMGSNTTLANFNEVPRKVQMNGADLATVKAISGGNRTGYALLVNGDVVAWGSNSDGQLGRGHKNTTNPVDYAVNFVLTSSGVKLTNIIQIEAFDYGCMALDKDGFVWTWGQYEDGALGRYESITDYNLYAGKVRKYNAVTGTDLSNIVKISAGDNHALAIDNKRQLWSWGGSWACQLGRTYGETWSANQVMAENLGNCMEPVGNTRFNPAEKKYYYLSGNQFNIPVTDPNASSFMRNVTDIAAGQASSIALLANGMVVSWGADFKRYTTTQINGALGRIPSPSVPTNQTVITTCPNFVLKNATTKLTRIVSISDGDFWYFARDVEGNTWCWGSNMWSGYDLSRDPSEYPQDTPSFGGTLGLGSSKTANQPYAVINPNFSSCMPTCPPISIIAPPIVCKNGTTYALTGTPAAGVFSGSGMSGNIFNPASLVPGEYIITYTVSGLHVSCPKVAKAKIVVPPAATMLTHVLSITAGTYNDAWPVDASVPASTIGYYANGIKSGWAPEESYAYVDDRSQVITTGDNVTLKTDGIMPSVPMFNWDFISNGECYPNWRKINTITQIASGTGQTENKDILNTYDAAIFGYTDQLSLAIASNAQYKEITYDGFEEYVPGTPLTIASQIKNNLTLLNTIPTPQELGVQYFEYEIIQAVDNVITIEYPGSNMYTLTGTLAGVFGAGALTNTDKKIHGYFKITNVEIDETTKIVSITLDIAEFTYAGVWKGKISLPNILSSDPVIDIPNIALAPIVVTSFNNVAIKRKAHSGEKFLRVSGNTEIEQLRMQLVPLKKYVISCWISTDEQYPATFADLTKGRGIAIDFIDVNGNKIAGSTVVFDPTDSPGNIIEGWQRIEGTFTAPANTARFTLRFLTPANTATYFDDLRLFPASGNMQSYVYNNKDYKLRATLDQNNYATYYYYDEQGALYLVKKETERGIETIQEVFMHQTEINK